MGGGGGGGCSVNVLFPEELIADYVRGMTVVHEK